MPDEAGLAAPVLPRFLAGGHDDGTVAELKQSVDELLRAAESAEEGAEEVDRVYICDRPA
ncbi:hypothetical protein BRC67_04225 [Halobacteriales archaeon QH_3_68_24]|nr:MAG: hypothetical protein BRC67_04225 [Halobacteriales archaeon QH_3_68_24]